MQQRELKAPSLKPLVAALLAMVILFHLGNALMGKSLFRAIHLGTALEYARGPINLFRPRIVGVDANDAPVAQELPLWQAAAGLVLKVTHSNWYGWANLVSLVAFVAGLWPFFQLGRHYLGERAAWWALAFFLAAPVVVFTAGLASTDGLCLTITLWFLYFADRMIRCQRLRGVWWLLATVFASLGAISKAPFFMAAGCCSVGLLLLNRPQAEGFTASVTTPSFMKPAAGLLAAGLIAGVVFVGWTHYTNALLALVEYPYQELRLSHSRAVFLWVFGDWHFRLSPGVWLKGGWRFLHATLGSLPFVLLLLLGLARPGNRMPKVWLLGTLITTLVFTHIILVHHHYYLMCAPGVALLCGVTLARWEAFWAQEMPQSWLRLSLALVALIFSAIEGLIAMKVAIYYDDYPREMSVILARYTRPEDRLVIYGGDWGGEELFRSGRRGFYVFHPHTIPDAPTETGLFELLTSEAHLQRLKALGYNKVVLLSESPVRYAAVAVNPGSKRKRDFYPVTISPAVDAWPVVFRSEDILIQEIP